MERTQTFKITFLGVTGVGKTSIISRKMSNSFLTTNFPTVGVDDFPDVLQFNNHDLNVRYVDTAGQDSFRSLIPLTLRGSSIFILVFDLTSLDSLNKLNFFCEQINNQENSYKIILVGNKFDLVQESNSQFKEIQSKAEYLRTSLNCSYINVSALNGFNIESLFNEIAELLCNLSFPEDNVDDYSTPLPKVTTVSTTCCN